MVPNGWEKSDLTHLITIKHGFAFKSEFYSDKGQYVLLTPGSFYETGGFRDQGSKTKYYIGDIPDGYILSQGDMLLAMTEQAEGLLGSALFVPENNRYLHNQRLGLVQILNQEKVCKDFLYLFFNSPSIRKQITEQSTGTKVKHTSPDRLCSVIGLIPPLKEQQKIAEIISSWDQAISATEKLLENSQKQKKALMQQLLTGKKRLLDENGVRFSGVWKHIKLRSLIKEIKRDKEENPNNIELLTVKLHNKGAVASGKFPNSTEGGRPYYKRFAGELIIGRQNLHNGGVAIVPSECNGLIASNAISSFEALNDCDINFILSIMSTSHFRYLIDNLTGGTGQKEVSVRELLNVFVLIPCVEEQQKIAKVLTIADQEIETLQKKLDYLKQEKKALMQQLLTGKKRVKVAA